MKGCDKPTNQHKRLAMGDTLKGYAQGGSIGTGRSSTAVSATKSPLTAARRNNGIKGMKDGGQKC